MNRSEVDELIGKAVAYIDCMKSLLSEKDGQ